MMEFVMMTLSFALGNLLAMVIAFVVMLQPAVTKLYMKFIMKSMNNMEKIADEMVKEEE